MNNNKPAAFMGGSLKLKGVHSITQIAKKTIAKVEPSSKKDHKKDHKKKKDRKKHKKHHKRSHSSDSSSS